MTGRLERVEEKLDAVINLLMDLRQVFFEVAKGAEIDEVERKANGRPDPGPQSS